MGGVGYMEVLNKDEAWPAIFRDLLFFSALPPNTRHMTQHSWWISMTNSQLQYFKYCEIKLTEHRMKPRSLGKMPPRRSVHCTACVNLTHFNGGQCSVRRQKISVNAEGGRPRLSASVQRFSLPAFSPLQKIRTFIETWKAAIGPSNQLNLGSCMGHTCKSQGIDRGFRSWNHWRCDCQGYFWGVFGTKHWSRNLHFEPHTVTFSIAVNEEDLSKVCSKVTGNIMGCSWK